jgi:hypothetical protein
MGPDGNRRFRCLKHLPIDMHRSIDIAEKDFSASVLPSVVQRVVLDPQGVYAVTVRGDTGEHIVYVNSSGAVVQAPATTTTTTTVRGTTGSEETVVTQQDIQGNQSRYELLEKKGDKEVYLDHQTGQKVIVKRKRD